MAAAQATGMQTNTKNRLDVVIRRAKRRSVYDLVLPAMALVGLAMAGAGAFAPVEAAAAGDADPAALVADAELAD